MSYNDLLAPYSAAALYVPWQDVAYNMPDYWAGIANQDISPPGSSKYWGSDQTWMTPTERRVYTEMQRKVMTGVISGGKSTGSLTAEEQLVSIGVADNYVDRINNIDLANVKRGVGSTQSTPTIPTTPLPTETTDPSQIVNYYYNTTNNYNQDPSQGPSGSDSFSWLFPVMLMMMLMNNFGGVNTKQEAQPRVIYESW